MGFGVKRRRGLVHGIAKCDDCDWDSEDYLNIQRKVYNHVRNSGHTVRLELGYAVEYSSYDRVKTFRSRSKV